MHRTLYSVITTQKKYAQASGKFDFSQNPHNTMSHLQMAVPHSGLNAPWPVSQARDDP